MTNQNFISERINTLKSEYAILRDMQDCHIFTMLCIKYFFFSDGIRFDPDTCLEYHTDGANDGGIDAIFNDPNSEGNDMIIVQSKYYENTKLTGEDVAGELYKIAETVKNIDRYKTQGYNEKVLTAYRNAKSQMEDTGCIRIFFCTSYAPKTKREQNKIEKANASLFNLFDVEMAFCADIEAQIESIDNGKLFVDYDKLTIDKTDNFLSYEDSIIVNISAQSLQDLQNRRRNGLLGMNLRYYIRQKTVDEGISKTVRKEPDNFWYKNNGIIIVCENYQLDGRTLKLHNFSIVNGGQTTHKLGHLDIERDFYLQCKVVKTKGESRSHKDEFTLQIAEASNSQKTIKKADLKSNTKEQYRLKEKLYAKHVYYITKKGDRVPKQYSEPYHYATLEQVGKLGFATVLQMPGTARSQSSKMYQDEYYYSLFGDSAQAGIIADTLRIAHYYDLFVKHDIKNAGYDERTTLPMIRNGKTFQLACISFLCKLEHGVFSYDTIAGLLNNTDELKRILKQTGDMTNIVCNNISDEKNLFFKIFSIIGEDVLGACFDNALDLAERNQDTLIPSNYLKSDSNYYKDILKKLWRIYNRKESGLQDAISCICRKD